MPEYITPQAKIKDFRQLPSRGAFAPQAALVR